MSNRHLHREKFFRHDIEPHKLGFKPVFNPCLIVVTPFVIVVSPIAIVVTVVKSWLVSRLILVSHSRPGSPGTAGWYL